MGILSILSSTIIFAPILLAIDEFGFIIPIGDVIVIYTGYEISSGRIPYVTAFLLLLAGIIVGSSSLYYVSYKYGRKFVVSAGKYLDLDMEKIDGIEQKFNKYGPLLIIFGRHVLGFRIPITIFSGIAKVPYVTFIVSVIISTIFWLTFYLFIGMKYGSKAVSLMHNNNNLVFYIFIPLILIYVIYRYLHKKNNKRKR